MSFVKEKSIQIPLSLFRSAVAVLGDAGENPGGVRDNAEAVRVLASLQEIQRKRDRQSGRNYGESAQNQTRGASELSAIKRRTGRASGRKESSPARKPKAPDMSLVGKKFGSLTILGYLPSENGFRMAQCRCDCSRVVKVKLSFLKSGNTKSCGCARWRRKELTGSVFGKLTVTARSQRSGYWTCECECGNAGEFRGSALKNGYAVSCGCMKKNAPLARLISSEAAGSAVVRTRCSRNTSGHVGVSLVKRSNKWIAYIQLQGKRFDLGLFTSMEEAAAARHAAEAQLAAVRVQPREYEAARA